jgi:hypothetical protein
MRSTGRGADPINLYGDDQFNHPFPPYLVRALSAGVEVDGAPPPQRSKNNIE